jgi:hypothetical protein
MATIGNGQRKTKKIRIEKKEERGVHQAYGNGEAANFGVSTGSGEGRWREHE